MKIRAEPIRTFLFLMGLLTAPASVYADWHSSRSKDAMTDEITGYVSAPSETRPQAVFVKCGSQADDDNLNIAFAVWEPVRGGYSQFKYRFDNEEVRTDYNAFTLDGKIVVVSDAIEREFLSKMKSASRLAIQVPPYESGRRIFVFDLNGFTKAFNEACTGLLEAASED